MLFGESRHDVGHVLERRKRAKKLAILGEAAHQNFAVNLKRRRLFINPRPSISRTLQSGPPCRRCAEINGGDSAAHMADLDMIEGALAAVRQDGFDDRVFWNESSAELAILAE